MADEAAKKPEVIHLKKSFGGKTATEVHQEIAWAGKRCFMCRGPPVIRIKSFCMVAALKKKDPIFAAQLAANSADPGKLPVYPTLHGDALWISDVYACSQCKAGAERAAAKHGSDFFVEIDRGPDPRPPMVAVPG